jgi:hypothetical protein
VKRTDISLQKQEEEEVVDRANLMENLALRTEEVAQHDRNFQQMAELAPCGEMESSNICRGRPTNLGKVCLPLTGWYHYVGQLSM